MNIPQLDSCRFITLNQIAHRIKTDTFQYKSVRVAGKIVDLQNAQGLTVIRQPDWQKTPDDSTDEPFMVNTFAVRDRHLEINKVYEFFGEIEEAKDGLILLKARVVKPLDNFHPKVYIETTSDM